MERYLLKHKNNLCGVFLLDKGTGQLQSFEMIDPKEAPFLGNANSENMRKWWAIRAVPGTRSTFEQVLRDNNCISGEAYLAKNLGLSLNDSYWICPVDIDLDYDDINLYEQKQYYKSKMPYRKGLPYHYIEKRISISMEILRMSLTRIQIVNNNIRKERALLPAPHISSIYF